MRGLDPRSNFHLVEREIVATLVRLAGGPFAEPQLAVLCTATAAYGKGTPFYNAWPTRRTLGDRPMHVWQGLSNSDSCVSGMNRWIDPSGSSTDLPWTVSGDVPLSGDSHKIAAATGARWPGDNDG
jgi:hypothetical protein